MRNGAASREIGLAVVAGVLQYLRSEGACGPGSGNSGSVIDPTGGHGVAVGHESSLVNEVEDPPLFDRKV